LSYLELLSRFAPETIVVITALVVLGLDLLVLREEPLRNRLRIGAAFSGLGCVAAAAWLLAIAGSAEASSPFATGGMLVDDPLTRLVKVALLALGFFAILLATEGNFTAHVGEYLSLVLLSVVGMMLMVSSTDLLMIFIALEATSLPLYILAAFNPRDPRSSEAALKYFLFGGMAAAFTLFGLSLVYGLAGSTNLAEIAVRLADTGRGPDALLPAALALTLTGLAFKVAAAPFHLWAPDAYEGAPAPSASLIASGSKVAGFFLLARVMMVAFAPVAGSGTWHHYAAGWMPLVAILAGLSVVIGNLAAIAQSNVKRLLAYSAVAHTGYALLGVLANDPRGVSSLVYYVITYGLTLVGAFAVVSAVEDREGGSNLTDFAGLGRREPLLSFCMMIFMLSLAGIPPLAGFFGKFYLFAAIIGGARNLGWLWLVVLAVAMSAVSLYYYLQVLKQIYVLPEPERTAKRRPPMVTKALVGLLALGVVIFGCAPDLLLRPLLAVIHGRVF